MYSHTHTHTHTHTQNPPLNYEKEGFPTLRRYWKRIEACEKTVMLVYICPLAMYVRRYWKRIEACEKTVMLVDNNYIKYYIYSIISQLR
jgi:hypothetical protein